MPLRGSLRSVLLGACLLAAAVTVLASGGCTGTATSRPGSGGEAAHTAPHTARHTPAQAAAAPASATTPFGLQLMRSLGAGNLVLSPDSIAAALAMAGSGAAGDTAAQIAQVLHLASPHAFAAVGQLQGALAAEQLAAAHGDPQAPTLDLANGLFLQQGYAVEPAFQAGLQSHFGVAPQTVDFRLPGAVEAINTWVSRHTQGVIPHILSSLSPQTRLALANAIYLKAAWRYPFKPGATASAPFHGQHESGVIPFMHETDELPYGRGRGYAAVDLPYRSSTLSLLVVLPVGQTLGALERGLSAGRLNAIVRGLSAREVLLSLPRFRLTTHTALNGALEALGMTAAFSEAADFSAITTAEALKIGLVEHAADFRVDEAGTVAAAATVVTIEPTVARAPGPHSVPFNADRPFLFFLRDDRSGALLFAGRLVDPASARLPA
jgi:serpin B